MRLSCAPISIVPGRVKRGEDQAIGRSRGGSTKIHALVDALGNPVTFALTQGQMHDLQAAPGLIENVDPNALIADKAFDADSFVELLQRKAITPVIPPRATARTRDPAISCSTRSAI